MDCSNGRIYNEEQLKSMFGAVSFNDAIRTASLMGKKIVPMKLVPTAAQMEKRVPKVGRNDLCPCGSGKKFKRCCLLENWKTRYGG